MTRRDLFVYVAVIAIVWIWCLVAFAVIQTVS
jgi:hypothetical protein